MSTVNTLSGQIALNIQGANNFSVDSVGSRIGSLSYSKAFNCIPALPNVIGIGAFLNAVSVVCASGSWLLANADPFQGMGDSVIADGLVAAGRALKALVVVNTDTANSITVKRAASLGLAIFDTAGAGQIIKPGGVLLFLDPTGLVTGALTGGANDALTISVSGGAPVAQVLAIFGE